MNSIREEITAAVCEVIHPQPSPDNDRAHCQTAEAVLSTLAKQIRATTTKIPHPPGSEALAYEYWRGYRNCAVEIAVILEKFAEPGSSSGVSR